MHRATVYAASEKMQNIKTVVKQSMITPHLLNHQHLLLPQRFLVWFTQSPNVVF